MKIPGFTASTTLYYTGGRYRTSGGNLSAWTNAPAVVPQLPRQLGLLQCLQGCSVAGADPACEITCFRKADIQASDDFQSGGGRSTWTKKATGARLWSVRKRPPALWDTGTWL